MTNKIEVQVVQNGMTRRAFLVRTVGIGTLLIASPGMSGLVAACAKPPPTPDFTVASTVPDPTNHSHNVKIIGADVDNPPSEKPILRTA